MEILPQIMSARDMQRTDSTATGNIIPVTESQQRDPRPAVLSALAALALYAVTLAGTYVYDDMYIVQLDPRVRDVAKWPEYWTKDYFYGGADNLYRPLVSMTYAVQATLQGNGESQAWA